MSAGHDTTHPTPNQGKYPGTVTFDVRITVPVEDFPFAIGYIEDFCADEGFRFEYPSDDGLPHEHTLPGMELVDQIIGD